MDSYNRIQLGDDNADNIMMFERRLSEIELNNKHWFDQKEDEKTGEKPDSINNYIRYHYDNFGIKLYVRGDLPGPIRDELNLAFIETFPDQNPK